MVSGVCLILHFSPRGISLPLLFHCSGWLGVECDMMILFFFQLGLFFLGLDITFLVLLCALEFL